MRMLRGHVCLSSEGIIALDLMYIPWYLTTRFKGAARDPYNKERELPSANNRVTISPLSIFNSCMDVKHATSWKKVVHRSLSCIVR
jgi:hypothetical protein